MISIDNIVLMAKMRVKEQSQMGEEIAISQESYNNADFSQDMREIECNHFKIDSINLMIAS